MGAQRESAMTQRHRSERGLVPENPQRDGILAKDGAGGGASPPETIEIALTASADLVNAISVLPGAAGER